MTEIICLTGLSSCGKSYMTGHYFRLQGYQVLSLATPIYQILSVISKQDISTLHLLKKLPDKLLYGKDTREALCQIGQGLRESIHNDIWVDLCIHTIKNPSIHLADFCYDKYVIDDIRDVGEYNKIKKMFPKTKLIYVYREDNNPYLSSDSLVQERESHYGELEKCADIVFNNTIPQMYIHSPEKYYENTLGKEIRKWLL